MPMRGEPKRFPNASAGAALVEELQAASRGDLERAMRFSVLGVDDPTAVEGDLFSELLDHYVATTK